MPNVKPHKAFVYSQDYRKNLADLISPPYDVISKEGHEKLLAKNDKNSVQLALTDDPSDESRYQKLKDRLNTWKETGVFETIDPPAFYLVEEKFKVAGEWQKRIGFVGLLEVSSFDKKEVYPHEYTLSGPKKDRFSLLQTMGAELSQIFFCYQDEELTLEKLYEQKQSETPFMDISNDSDVPRRVWLIQDESEIKSIQSALKKEGVLIADGHHRYETALKMSQDHPSEKTKFVQGYFTNLKSPGFGILPIHRLFSLPKDHTKESFLEALKEKFEVSPYKKDLDLDELHKQEGLRFIYAAGVDDYYLLQRKKTSATDAEIFLLQKEILEGILKWDVTQLAKGVIQFEHTNEDFKKTLGELDQGVGFYLPSTDLEVVMEVVKKGERMPQKSTFFFPKLASGLVNYELGSY